MGRERWKTEGMSASERRIWTGKPVPRSAPFFKNGFYFLLSAFDSIWLNLAIWISGSFIFRISLIRLSVKISRCFSSVILSRCSLISCGSFKRFRSWVILALDTPSFRDKWAWLSTSPVVNILWYSKAFLYQSILGFLGGFFGSFLVLKWKI